MNCNDASREISALEGGSTELSAQRPLQDHLQECMDCALEVHQAGRLRSALRALPRKQPPARLRTALAVIASQEQQRRQRRRSPRRVLAECAAWLNLWSDNLVRPLALPFAGGLASAIFLFTMLVPSFAVQAGTVTNDVPTLLTTEAMLQSSLSFGLLDQDVVVNVLVDRKGQVQDYSIPRVQLSSLSPNEILDIEKTLLCTRFEPATMFGRPAWTRLRITLRRSHVEVRG